MMSALPEASVRTVSPLPTTRSTVTRETTPARSTLTREASASSSADRELKAGLSTEKTIERKPMPNSAATAMRPTTPTASKRGLAGVAPGTHPGEDHCQRGIRLRG
ncbi:MAG: hypothetical protein AUG02_05195 [Chloroflexi bacterium 13_1_20CM_2_70_9]|nr:MAG: hypothetical protein AUG02_05195 [Chloroflexi bacterium 13_1_20CM_2_70_9]